MPLLQFETTLSLSPADREAFAAFVIEAYTTEMETSDGHVAVVLRERGPGELHLGRAVDGDLLFLDAEIREGRPFAYKRAFAVAVMEHAVAEFGVPEPNAKVVFTEHAGENMMGLDRVGGDWNGDEE